MSLVSYLFPRTMGRYTSKYNRDIRVVEEKGKYKLLVNGSRQSGEYVKMLWQHALCTFGIIPLPNIRKILVLGVAGGDIIHMLHAMYPDARITGVDIDEKMIELGKKYFRLGSITELTIVKSDAKVFIKKRKKWDLIICDTYIGAYIPPFVGEEYFIQDLKKILTTRGVVLINYLNEREYGKLSDILAHKLRKTFKYVQQTDIYFNRFFFSSDIPIS